MVEPGDTLYKISRFFATRPDILVRRNNLTNPERLNVGQFIDIFAPYVPTNMVFEKGEDGYTLKCERFLLIEDLKFISKTVNGDEIEYDVGTKDAGYLGKTKIEFSTSDIFKLSVLLNIFNPTIEEFNIMFEIPNTSFYMSTVEIFKSDSEILKSIISGEEDLSVSDIKRLKIKTTNGSFSFIFYGGIANVRNENGTLKVSIKLKILENINIYRTQMALLFQKD